MILYVLIALALASFVIAFFSARTWHWGYVVVVELLFLSTIGFFLLTSEVVRINAVLRTQINKDQKQLGIVEAQNVALVDGTENSTIVNQLSGMDPPVKTAKDSEGNEKLDSIANLDHKLLIATRLRGRVWRSVVPAGAPNAQTGVVNVKVPAPTPSGIKKDIVVFVFEEGAPQPPDAKGVPRGPQFLGEFTVTTAGPQQATLTPVLAMDDFERRRLAASRGPWSVYETMPLDRHEIFAGKPEPELQKLLPKKSIGEYLRDNTPATQDDDPVRVIGFDETGKPVPPADLSKAAKKIYQRRLRDYAAEYAVMARRRIALMTEIDAVNKDIARLVAAQEAAKKVQAFREDERTKLQADLAGVEKEKAAIAKHLADVQKLLARAQELTRELLKRNDQLAAELTARQVSRSSPAF